MNKAVEFLAGARADFDESFDWYASRSTGAAIGFASAVGDALEKLAASPASFPTTTAGCRYCSLKRYIRFASCFATSRSDWWWLPSRMPNVGLDTGKIALVRADCQG